VHARCAEIETGRAAKVVKTEVAADPVEEVGVKYPEDDINPDDIPF